MHISIIGAALSANKGAASMLRAAVEGLLRADTATQVTILTTYPNADRRLARDLGDRVQVVGLTPRTLVGLTVPALVTAGIQCLTGRGRGILRRHPAARAILDSDAVLDLAGVSFVDGRGIPILGYNTLMTGLPLLLGRPVVKGSQALGPFRRPDTRLAARLILPRVHTVCARGAMTAAHLDELGLTNVRRAADLAFLLDHEEAPNAWPRPTVGLVPSEVVKGFFTRNDQDYNEFIAELVAGVRDRGYDVRLIPHAIRPDRPASRMNDAPLAAELAALCDAPMREGDPSPSELRTEIARCDIVVTSRFHAMVSALATSTPVMVIGWSHKYREVLAQFGQDDAALDYRGLDSKTALAHFDRIAGDDTREETLRAHLPAVRDQAAVTLRAVMAAGTR
jgi:colanic acid/amylovoran biosynthesis protein